MMYLSGIIRIPVLIQKQPNKQQRFQPMLSIKLLVLLCLLNLVTSVSVIQLSPSQIQVGSKLVVYDPSIDLYPSPNIVAKLQYTISLNQMLQFYQNYQIVLGIRSLDIDYRIQRTWLWAPNGGYSGTSPTFIFDFLADVENYFFSTKVNYLLIGNQLRSRLLAYSQRFEIMGISFSDCNGLTTATTCTYSLPISVPTGMIASNFQSSLSVSGIKGYSANLTSQARWQLTANLISLTQLDIKLTVINFYVYDFAIYFIYFHNNLFNTAVNRRTLISKKSISHSCVQPDDHYQDTLSVKVTNQNFFIGIWGLSGENPKFKFSQPTPIDKHYKVDIWNSMTQLKYQSYVFYSILDPCFVDLNCETCYYFPVQQCTVCRPGFRLDSGNCICDAPKTIVGNLCDNFITGCTLGNIIGGSAVCVLCDPYLKLVLDTINNVCKCKAGYAFDANNFCVDECGDGKVIDSLCDDGNTISGDGCSSSCIVQYGYSCDTTVQPTFCKSRMLLKYEIQAITKNEQQNSAKILVRLPPTHTYPLPVLKGHFQPFSSYFTLKIILSRNPYQDLTINSFPQFQIDEDNVISFSFPYEFTLQGLDGVLTLNYGQTLYSHYTQNIKFKLEGSNQPLKYQGKLQTFKQLEKGIITVVVFNIILLLIGLLTSKFIGLQSILTLQLMFFSQLLIYKKSKIPTSFVFLTNLKYTSGYNDFFDFVKFIPITEATAKIYHLKMRKLIVQNFNLNWVILAICFIALFPGFILRLKNEKEIQNNKIRRKIARQNKEQFVPVEQNQLYRKINDISFWTANQMALWLFLPFLSSLMCYGAIQSFTITKHAHGHELFETKADQIISFTTFTFIFSIILSNFRNIWLSTKSMKFVLQRPQEIMYKRILAIYLGVVGVLVCFFNDLYAQPINLHMSAVVLAIQLLYIILLIVIKPYKQSLKVHTFGLLLNATMYLLFLVVINIINYVDNFTTETYLIFGFLVTFMCSVSIILTILRLYYEMRYGRDLQLKIQEERQRQRLQEKRKLEQSLKRKRDALDMANKLRTSQKQKMRNNNFYLYENQLKQDQQKQLLDWLQNKNWEQKEKQTFFFKKFTQKPLDWLFKNEKQKYDAKIQQLQKIRSNAMNRSNMKAEDPLYTENVQKLKKQIKAMRKYKNISLKTHEENIKKDPTYAMNIMHNEHDRYIHPAYDLKN